MLTDQDERCGICGDPKPVDNNDNLWMLITVMRLEKLEVFMSSVQI